MKSTFLVVIIGIFIGVLTVNNSVICGRLSLAHQDRKQVVEEVGRVLNDLDKIDPATYCSSLKALTMPMLVDSFKEFLSQAMHRWPHVSWCKIDEIGVYRGSDLSGCSVSLSGDGHFFALALADGSVKYFEKIWDGYWRPIAYEWLDNAASIALSLNGQVIALGTRSGAVKIYNKNTNGRIELSATFNCDTYGHEGIVNTVAVSADGLTVLSGASDNKVHVYKRDVSGVWVSLDEFGCSGVGGISSVALSADAKHAAYASWSGDINIYQRPRATQKFNVKQHIDVFCGQERIPVNSIALNADGSTLVAGLDNGMIRVFEKKKQHKWEYVHDFSSYSTGSVFAVNSVALSLDGNCVASGSDDGVVRVYRRRGQRDWTCVSSFFGSNRGDSGSVYAVSLSGDGFSVVSGSSGRGAMVSSVLNFDFNLERLLGFIKKFS